MTAWLCPRPSLEDVPNVLCCVAELAACNAGTEVEVADTDVAHLALLDHLLEVLPGGNEVGREDVILDWLAVLRLERGELRALWVGKGDGPVHEVEVQVVCTEVSQRSIETLDSREERGEEMFSELLQ